MSVRPSSLQRSTKKWCLRSWTEGPVVEYLPSMHQVLNSTPSTKKIKPTTKNCTSICCKHWLADWVQLRDMELSSGITV